MGIRTFRRPAATAAPFVTAAAAVLTSALLTRVPVFAAGASTARLRTPDGPPREPDPVAGLHGGVRPRTRPWWHPARRPRISRLVPRLAQPLLLPLPLPLPLPLSLRADATTPACSCASDRQQAPAGVVAALTDWERATLRPLIADSREAAALRLWRVVSGRPDGSAPCVPPSEGRAPGAAA
ncbi:hypothetical protein ACFV6E_28840 [Streptomyces sp. NPDC059785]|uniref:hypothetical protein n=1 Tax=unclassified Streptomyces TaxID=2593676 RepID=UPI0036574DC6